jgi:hypothetical protein
VVTSARKVIDFIGKIKNTELTGVSLHELRTLSQILVDACNSKPLKTFPVKIIDEAIEKVGFEIRSTYSQGLTFSEVPNFVIDSLRQAENHMDDTRCLDALRVLVDYCNVIIYSRFNHGLEIEPRIIARSNHSANGDQL